MKKRLIEVIACGLVVAALAVATYYRNEIWGSEMSLWRDAAKKSPYKDRPAINLATALAQQGRFEEAKHGIQRYLEINPQSIEAQNNLGAILSLQGKYDEALYHIFEALRIDPKNPIAHNNAGAVLCKQGQYQEALIHFKEALKSKSDFEDARKNYETISAAIKKKVEAKVEVKAEPKANAKAKVESKE